MVYLKYFYKLIIFLPFFIGIIRFKKLSYQFSIILFYVSFGILTTLFIDVYQYFGYRNTLPIGHFYILISFLIFSFFYRSVLKSYINLKVLSGITIAYLIFYIINLLFIQSLFVYPNITGAFYAIIIAIFSVLLFAKIMSEAKIEKLWSEPIIWINLGILVYHAGNFFYYILFNYSLSVSNEFASITVYFNWIVGILFYLLISIGFLKVRPTKRRVRR